MRAANLLSDHDHPTVQATANQLAARRPTPLDRVKGIFDFVRDQVLFGFPPKWDAVKASETLQYGLGYCNTKATLFVALCRAVGIPARIHTGLIDIRIMRGVFPSFAFPFLPATGGHSWAEVEMDGEWKPVDSYINDEAFYRGALRRFEASDRDPAFSICQRKGPSSCDFNFGDRGFVHMGAVVEDHGPWSDFSEYMASDRYRDMKRGERLVYPVMAWASNRSIAKIRA